MKEDHTYIIHDRNIVRVLKEGASPITLTFLLLFSLSLTPPQLTHTYTKLKKLWIWRPFLFLTFQPFHFLFLFLSHSKIPCTLSNFATSYIIQFSFFNLPFILLMSLHSWFNSIQDFQWQKLAFFIKPFSFVFLLLLIN